MAPIDPLFGWRNELQRFLEERILRRYDRFVVKVVEKSRNRNLEGPLMLYTFHNPLDDRTIWAGTHDTSDPLDIGSVVEVYLKKNPIAVYAAPAWDGKKGSMKVYRSWREIYKSKVLLENTPQTE